MNSREEMMRWLKDAKARLKTAEDVFSRRDWSAAVQSAQLCIELSTKAVIAYFVEPIWRHDPGDQLVEIMEVRRKELIGKFGEDLLKGLEQMARDVNEVAPWHGWSTYGRKTIEGWQAAVDVCDEEVAGQLLGKARKSFSIATKFMKCLG